MNNRIFFVGMHNKPGMKPLDSKTMTGKVVDQIIKGLKRECIKTNLCETDYLPGKDEIYQYQLNWMEKYRPTRFDTIVLLGTWVKKNFIFRDLNTVFIGHPAGIYGPKNKDEYITMSIVKIGLNSIVE
jgi:hypothetical protein